MSKRIEKDGKFYRMRRGKLVEIPEEWVGKVTTPQTIAKRPSKMTNKARMKNKEAEVLTRQGDHGKDSDYSRAGRKKNDKKLTKETTDD